MDHLLDRKAFRLFLELPDTNTSSPTEEQAAFLHSLDKLEYGKNERVISEGDQGEALYILDKGTVKVVKESEGGKTIGELHEGDFFGELSLFTGKPRAASIVAQEDVTVYRLTKDRFHSLIRTYPNMSGTFLRKLYDRLTESYEELETANKELTRSNQLRKELGSIFTWVVLAIGLYTFVLGLFNSSIFSSASNGTQFVLNLVLELFTLFLIIRIVVGSSLPLSSFGLTLKQWKPAIKQSLVISAIAVIVLTFIKYLAVIFEWPFLPHETVVDMSQFNWRYITYLVEVPLQEFIGRGVLQGSIRRLLDGRYATLCAIVVSSLLFGALHLHVSVNLGIASLVMGILWGWMYSKYPNLIGVSICHFIIGNYSGLLGFWTIL
ncbi:cyclic nucleotide-binding domain-containing protein [Paenibacillus thermotolerans]|uniref:cyclic nucleotide-binding domain-containing protein n=1 Tax=Paenibacillus thermotolerans TaxID=3027807 RepID=UPI002368895D|nr:MULTISPECIES: cyclic nucleotide-binding domain-containing protein [unclassified Paenibacillus]